MISFDAKSSWLFANQPHKTHDITHGDINYLLHCADVDENWADGLKQMVKNRDKISGSARDFLIDEQRIRNTSGTIIPFPFGDRIITFASKRQFYRGENQDFPSSIPSLRRKTR